MSLDQFTIEELQRELEKRKTSNIEDEQLLCVGLIDDEGAESIIIANTPDTFSSVISRTRLRARFNSQRNPIVYSIKIPLSLFKALSDKIKEGNVIECGEVIKGLSNFKSLGY